MPIYEYVCDHCRAKFEKLVPRFGDAVCCPGCGSASVEKQLSSFAVKKPSAGSGAAMACGLTEAGCGAPACGGGSCGMPD